MFNGIQRRGLLLVCSVKMLLGTSCTSQSLPVPSRSGADNQQNFSEEPASGTVGSDRIESNEGIPMSQKVIKTDEEWRQVLTPEQFRITRKKGTEPSGSGEHAYSTDKGTYQCVCCELELFSSKHKFESGTGWPSFDRPIKDAHVGTKDDHSLFRTLTEVICNRCEAHLGHVFDDGPEHTTGMRFCINSVALDFEAHENSTEHKSDE